jgi:hypothetical protein
MKGKTLECVHCGGIQTIQRKDSKDRPSGHIKHLWCSMCKARRPHIELDEFERAFEKNVEKGYKALVVGAMK